MSFFQHAAPNVYDVDATTYRARVIADGGVVISMLDVDSAIKHAKFNGYWDSVAFWTSAQFGVKKDGSNAVSKLYCLKGNDAAQTTGSAQPIWTANQQNGRAMILGSLTTYLVSSALHVSTNFTVLLCFKFGNSYSTGLLAGRNSATWGEEFDLNVYGPTRTTYFGVDIATLIAVVDYLTTNNSYIVRCSKNGASSGNLILEKNGGDLVYNTGLTASTPTNALNGIAMFRAPELFGDLMIFNSYYSDPCIVNFQNQKWAIY